ncbi:MAG: preprotein translocase subunit SecE [Desulfobacterales bacterium]|nr:MAG: preprotein translocase subunit SecE [Desulfobacterales bacterium]
MGRIQRKKTPGNKKKKKQRIDAGVSADSHVKNSAAATQLALTEDKPAETDKKPPPTPKKPTTVINIGPKKQQEGFVGKAFQFLREVKIELKKVTWPSRKQTIGSTVVVIALVMLISLFLGVVDIGLSSLIRVVLQ